MTQKDTLDILKLGYNVFLTGPAGSGKTHILNQYIEYLKSREISVGLTAATGVAATHINGITLNSWAGIGVRTDLTDLDIAELYKRKYLRNRIQSTHVLVIDEVSMVSAKTLDLVDRITRAFRDTDQPFGGMQVVLCGDFFQLLPVNRDNAKIMTADKSSVWPKLRMAVCYLDHEFRHDDEVLSGILREIRKNLVTQDTIKLLAARIKTDISEHKKITRLYTHNVNVDRINREELEKITNRKAHYFKMETSGVEYLSEILKKSCLAPVILALKKGALVMFVKNSFERGYVNGTVGTVIDFHKGYPVVETLSGRQIRVTPESWKVEEEGEVRAKIKQLPLRLAWAITVHKSQGMSIDAAEIDLGRPFMPGMGYVALSRVRNLSGVRLLGLNQKALEVNSHALELEDIFKKQSDDMKTKLYKLPWVEKQTRQMEFVRLLKRKTRKIPQQKSRFQQLSFI